MITQVITHPGGMYLIFKHDARGHEAPEGGVLINQIHPDWACHKWFISVARWLLPRYHTAA